MLCTTRDIEIVSKSHFHDDLHLRVKMENFMLSRNAHKRNSRAHFQHVSWIFSLCTLNYRTKIRLRLAMIHLHNFCSEKSLVIDVKICMHEKIQIVPSVCALLKSQHMRICTRFIMLYIIASPERVAIMCALYSQYNTTVNMTKSVHI